MQTEECLPAQTAAAPSPNVSAENKQRCFTLYLIILIKLGKGLLLLLIAFGVYKLAGTDLQENFRALLKFVNIDPERQFFSQIGAWLESVNATNVRLFATGTLLYSMFSLVEGVGLVFRVSWAGWMAIGESAFFIPIEVRELVQSYSTTVALILLINIGIVYYLYSNRQRLFHHHH
jgi:uncharacterized membrane protein (DUF2068 family)